VDRVARLGKPRRRAVPSAVGLALLLLLASGASEAGEKVDLSPYLGIVPQVMDSRSYENPSGPAQTEQVLSVTQVGGGWEIVTQVGTSERRELVLPGDRVRVDGIPFLQLTELQTWARLLARLPCALSPLRRRLEQQVDFSVHTVSRSRAIGFEPLDTPAFSFPSVLRVDTELVHRTKSRNPAVPSGKLTIPIRHWYLAGVGRVASEFGEPLTGVPDEWLFSAEVNGIVLPPPEAP
jgi:hypothetical protein